MARNNQIVQAGIVLNAALTGTGSAATLFAARADGYVDIELLLITGTANDSAVLSDGTNSYTIKIGANSAAGFALPGRGLKATNPNAGWTLNMASTSFAVSQAVVVPS